MPGQALQHAARPQEYMAVYQILRIAFLVPFTLSLPCVFVYHAPDLLPLDGAERVTISWLNTYTQHSSQADVDTQFLQARSSWR